MEKPDPRTGFCSETKTFHSLRPPLRLPPENTPLSAASYALSLHSTGHRISYTQLRRRVKSLAFSLSTEAGLSRNDVAFVLSPNSTRVPILYFALLSIGVAISPANPLSTNSEISRQIELSKPIVAFATSATARKLPERVCRTILIDSDEFESMMMREVPCGYVGMERQDRSFPVVGLYPLPYFNIFGFVYALKSVALGETVLVMERYELGKMLRAVEEYNVTHLAVVPPIVVAMVKSDLTEKFDLGSLEAVRCGAAPLHKDLIEAFMMKFPGVFLFQGYGMTETTAKIVDPETGIALPCGTQGELWMKGPIVMKGYLDDPKANSETFTSEGWLRTGDICYIDDEGHLFVVDRLKELIKYKGYQVPPAELEQLLLSHPDITDAAVIPYPDEEAAQVPLAFVVRRPQSNLNGGQIIEFIGKQVSPYKKVRRVVFVHSIPKSAAGKILRKELKKISLPHSKL
ncbi:hypothetical protein BUALT_Bualt04G0170500 [Buddleja alternifolia]|uniref:4-coumarate--CoA ligase n=1 Tax=Buddleja alternifolia TaxID=168488 RepID=A0AAV6XPM6_9LAMI|nr:hypothetical protein BUALT_Bualt04G0170500 [Buddleja alternifolia]